MTNLEKAEEVVDFANKNLLALYDAAHEYGKPPILTGDECIHLFNSTQYTMKYIKSVFGGAG